MKIYNPSYLLLHLVKYSSRSTLLIQIIITTLTNHYNHAYINLFCMPTRYCNYRWYEANRRNTMEQENTFW